MGKTDFLTNVVTHRAFVFSYNWAMTPVRNRTPLLGHFLAMVPPLLLCAKARAPAAAAYLLCPHDPMRRRAACRSNDRPNE